MAKETLLFDGISDTDCRHMLHCFNAITRSFTAGSTIYTYGDSPHTLGIIRSGNGLLLRILPDGRQTILEHLKAGDLIGEVLSPAFGTQGDVIATCTVNASVCFFDYGHLIKRCEHACACHSQLVDNTLKIILNKTARQSERIEVLSQRTTREKLLCYFRLLSEGTPKGTPFPLPFSLSTLADYLCVDRSAMTREIRKLKDDGLLSLERRTVTLH